MRVKRDFAPSIKNRLAPEGRDDRGTPPQDAAHGTWIGVQLSKSYAGLGNLRKPAHKIFSFFRSPVKVTTRGDNQERQGGMTTRSDKGHTWAVFEKKDRPTPFAGAMNWNLFRGFLPELLNLEWAGNGKEYRWHYSS